MARLNDPQMESLEARTFVYNSASKPLRAPLIIELLSIVWLLTDFPTNTVKKRYLRQNREIARANSTQSVRIRNLESETTRLLSENIELREQVIKLQASLDRRERTRVAIENVEATKQKLEEKVSELGKIIRGLGQAITTSPQVTSVPRQPRASIVSPDQRNWKNQFSLGEMAGSHDGQLPAIHEDARSRRSSLEYRNSLNFEDINLPPPRPTEYPDNDSDEDLRPPVSSLLETRPRRRRDSATALDLGLSTKPAAPLKNQSGTTTTENTLNKASKRKFEREAEAAMEFVADLESKIARMSERSVELARSTRETEPVVTMDDAGNVAEGEAPGAPSKSEGEKQSRIVRLTVDSDARGRKEFLLAAEHAPPIAAIAPNGRKALGPKSTNSDPANSPLKQANLAPPLANDSKNTEKVEKVDLHPPPTTKSYRGSNIRDKDTPPPDCEEPTNTRPSRRARSSVNYALPNLRDKMRREDKAAEIARAEGKTQKRGLAGKSRSKEPTVEDQVAVKREEPDDADDGKQWLKLPTMLPLAPGLRADEEPRKLKETGIGGLLEKKSGRERREKESDFGQPVSTVSQRRRRTSSLYSQLEGQNYASEETERPGALLAHADGRRKAFEGSNFSDGNSRTLIDSNAGRGKVYSHLPPSSTYTAGGDDVNDPAHGSRRVTLGGNLHSDGLRGARGVKSYGNLTSGDGDDGADRRKGGSGAGIGVRRRSVVF